MIPSCQNLNDCQLSLSLWRLRWDVWFLWPVLCRRSAFGLESWKRRTHFPFGFRPSLHAFSIVRIQFLLKLFIRCGDLDIPVKLQFPFLWQIGLRFDNGGRRWRSGFRLKRSLVNRLVGQMCEPYVAKQWAAEMTVHESRIVPPQPFFIETCQGMDAGAACPPTILSVSFMKWGMSAH